MVILLFFFFCVGLYTFSRGLKIFREIEILKGTPVLPIRNLPIGLVRIHGKASGDRLVSGPVSKTACHFYWVVIETMSNRSWGSYPTDADGSLFHLEDGPAKCRWTPTTPNTTWCKVRSGYWAKTRGLRQAPWRVARRPQVYWPILGEFTRRIQANCRSCSTRRACLWAGSASRST